MNKLFVCRHGREHDGRLTSEGMQDAHVIAERLGQSGFVSAKGIILCSMTKRAMATGKIVQDERRVPTLVSSELILKAGYDPAPLRELHHFVGDILADQGVRHDKSDVLIVTHAPLVSAAAKLPRDSELEPGLVAQVPEGWQNPGYRPVYDYLREQPKYWAPHAG